MESWLYWRYKVIVSFDFTGFLNFYLIILGYNVGDVQL